jgi:hypothetical protein
MKLPVTVLQGLAAVALASLSGCVIETSTPTNQEPPESQQPIKRTVEPAGQPQEKPGKLCVPDGCPGCGRG